MARVFRRILGTEEESRIFGRYAEVQNFGSGVVVTLYRISGKKVMSWTVEKLLLLDPSIVEVEPRGVITVRAVIPRILTAVYDAEEDSLRVAEVEPQALIPG